MARLNKWLLMKQMFMQGLYLALALLLAIIFIPTFLVGWDVYGIFIRLFKNAMVDGVIFALQGAIMYILFNNKDFVNAYRSMFQ